MTFQPSKLSCQSYADGYTHWLYKTADSLADIIAPDYFDSDAVRHNDTIMAIVSDKVGMGAIKEIDGNFVFVPMTSFV